MTLTPDMDRPSIGSGSRPPLPSWWRAGGERFDSLVKTRLHIYRREKAAVKKAQSVIAASLILAISIYSVDATGAVTIPAAPGFLALFAALAFPIAVAWLLDHRLAQQLNDINLRSELWLDLVEAVKQGAIDVAQLEPVPSRETDIEQLLRKEASVAARFLASRSTLVPRLPIFGHCFTLKDG